MTLLTRAEPVDVCGLAPGEGNNFVAIVVGCGSCLRPVRSASRT